MTDHTTEQDPSVYRSRWVACDECEHVTIIERDDSRGVPDETEWEEFGRCLVCGSSQLHWNADESTVADQYWRKGVAAGRVQEIPQSSSLTFRAVSPDGVFPEGFREWPTWSGHGMTLDAVRGFRDEGHPGFRLEVQETVVRAWRRIEEQTSSSGSSGGA